MWDGRIYEVTNLVKWIHCPRVFQEHYIAAKEFQYIQENTKKETDVEIPAPNYRGMIAMFISYFLFFNIGSLRETLGTAIIQDMYGLEGEVAMFYASIGLSLGGFIGVLLFLAGAKLAKIIDERIIVTFIGYGLLVFGIFAHYPIGNNPIPVADENCSFVESEVNVTDSSYSVSSYYSHVRHTNDNETLDCLGCPYTQTWCQTSYQIPAWQLLVTIMLTILGAPLIISLSVAIFSKILGPRPQGFWIGVLQACNSFTRILGPLWLSVMYEQVGYYPVVATVGILETLAMVTLLVNYKNIAPMKVKEDKEGADNLGLEEL